jgi:putative thioredoxin
MAFDCTNFEEQVLERSHTVPVLVDFWAPWCGPCRTLGPLLESLAAEATGRWELVKVNTETTPKLAEDYGITSIPDVKLFVGGQIINHFQGALPEREIRKWLEEALPGPTSSKLSMAKTLLEQDQDEKAITLLRELHQEDAANEEARLLLALATHQTEPDQAEELLSTIADHSDFVDRARILRGFIRFVRVAQSPAALPEHAVRAGYLAGAQALTAGDFDAALTHFIEVLRRKRDYDQSGAKEACKLIFQFLGLRHPIVEKHHRAFSSTLNS